MIQQSMIAVREMLARTFPDAPPSDPDIAAILALPFAIRTLEPGQYLLREGDRPTLCTLLLDGFAYRHKFVGDGGRQIVSLHLAGDFVDLQNLMLAEADHNIQALTNLRFAQFESEALAALAIARPVIGRTLWRESLIEASIFREWVANVGRRDARSRMAHLLCEIALRRERAGLGERTTFELPMTQEQLGDALGLTAVHVNRTLKALQKEGLIRRSKRSVRVTDWEGLRNLGDFTSAYLHGI